MTESRSAVSDSLQPHGLYSPWNSLSQDTGVSKPFPSPGDLPNPGIKPRSPTLQVDSLPAEPQGKPVAANDINSFLWLSNIPLYTHAITLSFPLSKDI